MNLYHMHGWYMLYQGRCHYDTALNHSIQTGSLQSSAHVDELSTAMNKVTA